MTEKSAVIDTVSSASKPLMACVQSNKGRLLHTKDGAFLRFDYSSDAQATELKTQLASTGLRIVGFHFEKGAKYFMVQVDVADLMSQASSADDKIRVLVDLVVLLLGNSFQ